MTGTTIAAYPLSFIPTATETKTSLDVWKASFPLFVHKWTKAPRQYRRPDLYLPAAVDFRGRMPDWQRPIVGVGGTRSPSAETFCLVSEVCALLASRGVILISGGVPGVDLSAHLAAIGVASGTTLAVLANPVDTGLAGHEWGNPYVQDQILRSGGFISEYRTTTPVFSEDFLDRLLARDRIISGLCDIFVAFECSENSATIDTARRALVQGKSLFGVTSRKRTDRRGIDQISAEIGFQKATVLRAGKTPPTDIAESIFCAANEAARRRNRRPPSLHLSDS